MSCHSLSEGVTGNVGPNLYPPSLVERLEKRLNSEAYVQAIRQLDRLDEEHLISYTGARQEVFAAEGLEQVRLWIKNRALEPKFDNPAARMPNLGLSESEAETIAEFFVSKVNEPRGIFGALKDTLPSKVGRRVLVAFSAGAFVAGMGFLFLLHTVLRVVRSRRRC